MAAKRKSTRSKKRSSSHSGSHHVRSSHVPREKIMDPGYMVKISEPNLLRKDLLESLREAILFMQSYEKFKKIQEDKVNLFALLKADLKEIDLLITKRLKAHFPQGKLHVITEENMVDEMDDDYAPESRTYNESVSMRQAGSRGSDSQMSNVEVVKVEPVRAAKSELDMLEDQLKDIEAQLKDIQ